MKTKARKLSVISLKGGCGKTTSTIQIAAALSDKGARVLVIDLDPSQANATMSLIGPIWKSEVHQKGICSAFIEGTPLDEIIYPTQRENLFIIPSEKTDSQGRPYSVETAIANMNPMAAFKSLSGLIEKSSIDEAFDFVVIDTGPTNSMIVVTALNASDYFIVPVEIQDFSIESIAGSMETGNQVKSINPGLQSLGFFVSSIDMRSSETKIKVPELEAYAKSKGLYFFKAKIPVSAKFGFLPSKMKTIFDVTKKSDRGHKEYLDLTVEIMNRIIVLDKAKTESSKRSQGAEV